MASRRSSHLNNFDELVTDCLGKRGFGTLANLKQAKEMLKRLATTNSLPMKLKAIWAGNGLGA